MAWYFLQSLSSNSLILTEDMIFFFFFGSIQGIYIVWLILLQSSVEVGFGGTQIPHTANEEKAGVIQRSQAKCLKELEGNGVNTTCVSTLNLIFK